jgi:molybdopterin-guanine dinucleotide biosynthesis protein A
MGVNKSLLEIEGKTVIARVRDLMLDIFSKVILVTNDPGEYKFLGLDIYEDVYKGFGPLAGIHSGLLNSSTQKNFIISCDIPFMTEEMICYLVDYQTNKHITIAKADGYIQQLAGVYYKVLLENIENILKNNVVGDERNEMQQKRGCKVMSLIDEVDAEIINTEKLSFYKPDTYFNMNRPKDFEYIKTKLGLSLKKEAH